MDSLTPMQIDQFKIRLEKIRDELLEQLDISRTAADPVELDQSAFGRLSRMDAIQQQGMARSAREQASQRLRRVNQALQAVDEGDYGYCKRCEEAIGSGRLQARPEAILCLNCQQRQDARP